MASLEPCPQCARHVRVGGMTCPFCGASIAALSSRPLQVVPVERGLTRAALVLMGAAAVVACGKTKSNEDVVVSTAYGGPPPTMQPLAPDAAMTPSAPAYGMPPPEARPDAGKGAAPPGAGSASPTKK